MVVSIAIFFAFLSILWQWLALKICLCVFVFTKSIIGTDFLTLFSLNLLNSYWCKLEVENQPCPCLLRSFTFNMCTYLYSVTYLSTDSTCMCVFSAGGGGGWVACTGACVDAARLFFTCVARSWYFLFWLVSHTRSGRWKHDLTLHLILYGWKKCHLS